MFFCIIGVVIYKFEKLEVVGMFLGIDVEFVFMVRLFNKYFF